MKNLISILFIGSLLICGYLLFKDYLIWDFNQVIAVMVLPLIFRLKENRKNIWLPFVTALFLIASFFTSEKSILFISWLLLLAQVLNFSFKTPVSPLLILIFVISPLMKFINNMFGFPLRLWLSDVAGTFLWYMRMNVITEGNVLTFKGVPFFVNEACAGMNMLTVSLIGAVAFMIYYEIKESRRFTFAAWVYVIGIAIGLNILTNLLRIILITFLMIMPDNWLHDVIGLLCLIFYTFLPLFFFVKIIGKYQSYVPKVENTKGSYKTIPVHLSMIIIFILFGFSSKSSSNYHKSVSPQIEKIELDKGLIYKKKIARFYNTSHDPKICWTGSGYELTKVNTMTVKGRTIYSGHLVKEDSKLFTSWWWTDGKEVTISPLEWRINMIKTHSEYYLMNVTASNEEELLTLLKDWM